MQAESLPLAGSSMKNLGPNSEWPLAASGYFENDSDNCVSKVPCQPCSAECSVFKTCHQSFACCQHLRERGHRTYPTSTRQTLQCSPSTRASLFFLAGHRRPSLCRCPHFWAFPLNLALLSSWSKVSVSRGCFTAPWG